MFCVMSTLIEELETELKVFEREDLLYYLVRAGLLSWGHYEKIIDNMAVQSLDQHRLWLNADASGKNLRGGEGRSGRIVN